MPRSHGADLRLCSQPESVATESLPLWGLGRVSIHSFTVAPTLTLLALNFIDIHDFYLLVTLLPGGLSQRLPSLHLRWITRGCEVLQRITGWPNFFTGFFPFPCQSRCC